MQLPGRNQSDGTAGSPGNPTGRLRIEAENFLLRLSGGGETEACGDLGGTLNVGYIDVGDSLSYDVTAPVSGTYTINFRLANGGPVSSFQVRNPVSRAVLATITVPNTGGWQNYITLSATATLPAGQQTLQLLCTAHNWNLNWLELLPPATGSGGYNGSGAYHIEAEDFISQNGTLLENCQDAGGTYNIGSIDNGDWLDYRINMPVGGSYQLRIRAASANSSNSLQLRTATGTVLATLNVTNTGGYQTFSTFTGSVILPAGVQTVRLQVTGGYMAVNWLELSAPPGAPPLDNYALIVRDNPNNTGGGLVYEAENTFTVEFWVKPSGTHELDGESTNGTAGTSGQKYVMYPTNGGDGYGSRAGMGISVGTNGVSVYEHADNYMPAVLVWQRPVDTAWMHVAVVYTNGRPSLYINGEWKKQGLQSGRQHVYPGTQFPGGFYGSQTNGQVDELRIWSVARTGAQIAANMTGELTGTQTGLQGYWPMNEGAGAVLHDVSGRGRDIDLTGAGYSGASWTNGRYSITTTTGTYRYGFNGQEHSTEIGDDSYTAEYWEYDSRIGRRWNVDPVVKSWLSIYSTFSNNPLINVDPNGDDDYFNRKGVFLGSTSQGNQIRVITASVTLKKAQANPTANTKLITNFSYLPKYSANRVMLAAIATHYARGAEITKNVNVADVSEKNSTGFLFYDMSTGKPTSKTYNISVYNGKVNPLADDINNMTNSFVHEKVHEDDNSTSDDLKHTDAILAQIGNESFDNTTELFKIAAGNYAATLLTRSLKNKGTKVEDVKKRIAEFNKSKLSKLSILTYDNSTNSVSSDIVGGGIIRDKKTNSNTDTTKKPEKDTTNQ